ncbi:MAG: hypothetical protein LBU82_06630 [Treponema sp.]|jgi:hypothetical protein|nr:hypothetical protein [Treponema sp.]
MATPRKKLDERLPKGRPSKYSVSMCNTVVSCMQKGYIVDEVCMELGIAKDTFFNWVKEHPDFSDSYKKGRAAFNAFWARAYKNVMMGIPLKPPKKKNCASGNRKEEETVEWGRANPAMMIFYMKAHCMWRETVNTNNKHKIKSIDPEVKEKLKEIFAEENTGETKRKSSG